MPTMPSIHDTETLLVQHYKGLIQHLKTAWIKVHEEKCALTERNAELLSEVAEAASSIVDRDRTIQLRDNTVQKLNDSLKKNRTGWTKTIGKNAVLSKHIQVLETEAVTRVPPQSTRHAL